uniref:Chemokine (C-C motif) ligand 34b, duplicate 4 n=1 Tax=Oncorhynchus kisutch TaxID=8019 RepID=A0A8C7NBS0_ONCKI
FLSDSHKDKMFMVTVEISQSFVSVFFHRRPSKVTTNCCTSVSDTPIKSELQGYASKTPCHPVLIFYTVKGEKICSDPKTLWVDRRKKVMKK